MSEQGSWIRFWVENINFQKLDEPLDDAGLTANMALDKSIVGKKDGRIKIIANASFRFEPQVLYRGTIDFGIEISSGKELSAAEIDAKVDEIKTQLASTVSYVTTFCGDIMYDLKLIVPPFFTSENG